jgi:uncharacterized membrane protein
MTTKQFVSRWQTRLNQPRYQYFALIGIILLGLVLRFYKLGEWSFWIDEIFTIGRAQAHVNFQTIISQWWHPSISVILTGITLNALGVSEWTARLVPAVIGILSIPILYFPIKKLWGPAAGLIAVLLLAVSPWHILWSQNARYFTSLMLIYTLALFSIFIAIEKDRPGLILVSFILLVLAIGERFYALFLAPVILAYLLLLKLSSIPTPPGFRPRNIIFILTPGIILVIFDSLRFLTTGYSYFLVSMELGYSQPIDDPLRLAVAIIFNIGIPLVILGFFSGIYLLWQKSRAGLFFFLSAIIPVILLLILNPFIFTRDRYVFITLPSWIILAAIVVKTLFVQLQHSGKLLAVAVLVLLLADAIGANLLYYQVNQGNRRDWRRAFSLVQERGDTEDLVVTWWPELGGYYLDNEITSWEIVDSDMIVQAGRKVWFVTDSETVWGNLPLKSWVEQNAELIEVLYLRLREDDFSLRVYLYDPAKHISAEGTALKGY